MFTLAPAKLKYKYNICVTDEIGQAALNIHLEINIHLSNWKLYCPLFSTHNRKKPFVKLNVKGNVLKSFYFPPITKVFKDLEKFANANIYFSDLQCNIFVHVEVYTCAVCTPVRGCVHRAMFT